MGDLNLFLKRVLALRQSIVDDGISYGVPFTENDLRLVSERTLAEGSSFVKVTLPILGKALDAGLISGIFKRPIAFSAGRSTVLPSFCCRVFDTIFDREGQLRATPNITSIFFLRQFLLLDSKLEFEPTAKQKEDAIAGFIQRQKRLSKVVLPKNHPVLERARRLLGRTLKGLDLSSISPGHGPGSVAEGFDRIERWGFTSWPSRAEKWYPFHEYGSQSFVALCASGAPKMVSHSITKCCLVPKDYKGPRLISSESAATQYLQQGQMKSVMRYVDSHPLMSRSIKFQDQTWNQRKSQSAFEDGAVTLDLSNASDTVSAALVWYLLAEVPKLRSQLFCTRSQSMRIEGKLIRITAFSPMGSAVCFPVETLVFWALSMASVRFVQFHWGDGSKDPTLPSEIEMASAIAVFGDDIIVPDYAMATLIGTLEAVGCEVNTSKTCYTTPFRESCGAEWFNNIDVTITRNRRYYYDVSKEVINYPVLLDLQRKFFLQGLYRTAALCLQWSREIGPVVTVRPSYYSFRPVFRGWNEGFITDVSGRSCREALESGSSIRHGECATAYPSGLGKYFRDSDATDTLCCAYGFDNSLDCGVRTRYNREYQRIECRLPRVFQRTIEWNLHPSSITPGSTFTRGQDGSSRVQPVKVPRQKSLENGYARLLSRVVGDTVERIAIRSVELKIAWSELPFFDVSQRQRG